MRPRGIPPTPSARSSDRAPVGIASTRTAAASSPIFMIEPLPNWRSICESAPLSAASRALAAFSCSLSIKPSLLEVGNDKLRVESDGTSPPEFRPTCGIGKLSPMTTWDDVARLALDLPETSERLGRGNRQWRVKDKLFVWERPLRQTDLAALGPDAPDGPILGARVEHELAKSALLEDPSGVFFTTPHFDGYPAILVKLGEIGPEELEEVVTEAWLCRAPTRLVKAYLDQRAGDQA